MVLGRVVAWLAVIIIMGVPFVALLLRRGDLRREDEAVRARVLAVEQLTAQLTRMEAQLTRIEDRCRKT